MRYEKLTMDVMKKSYIILLPLLMLLSCTDKESLMLFDEVESYIHVEPERALEVLEDMDSSGLRRRKGRARYSLLYTMALDKNWKTPTDESFIMPAVEYYRRHGNVDDRIKSLYYLGRIQYEGKFYSKAIVSFTQAYSLLDKSDDYRYCGLVNQAIADTYMATYNDSEVLPYLESAYGWFVKYGDTSLSDLTLYSMAGQYSILDRHEEADSLFRRVIEAGNIPERDFPEVLSNYALCLINSSSDDSQKIEELFSRAISLSGGVLDNFNLWGAYAYILARNGKNEESAAVFRQLEGHYCDDVSVDFWQSLAYAAEGEYEPAYRALKRCLFVQDSIIDLKLQQSAARAQRDYFALQDVENQTRLRNRSLLLALMILLFVIVLFLVYLVFRRRHEASQRERSELVAASELVRRELDAAQKYNMLEKLRFDNELHEREEMLARLKSEYVRIYRTQFRQLGTLCETFLTSDGYRDSHKVVYEKVREMIGDITGDSAGQKRFEDILNSSLGDVMKHFRDDFPSLDADDYRFFCYIIVGFDATMISVILRMPSQAAVYAKKSRMKKQISSSSSPYREQYLEFFV